MWPSPPHWRKNTQYYILNVHLILKLFDHSWYYLITQFNSKYQIHALLFLVIKSGKRNKKLKRERLMWSYAASVVSPVLSRAPKIHSWYMEFSMLSSGGGSMKWKSRRSWTPSDLSSSTTLARLVRWISGIVVVSISFLYALWVYNLKWTNTMERKINSFFKHYKMSHPDTMSYSGKRKIQCIPC